MTVAPRKPEESAPFNSTEVVPRCGVTVARPFWCSTPAAKLSTDPSGHVSYNTATEVVGTVSGADNRPLAEDVTIPTPVLGGGA